MQFTTKSVALFAALASAHQQIPQHFHHRRQLNETSALTTLTVSATQVYTITSCAPTVTDCPARNSASAGAVVTEIVALTTTVCPVAEASSVSSAIVSSAIASGSGSIVGPTASVSDNSGASITSAVIIPLTTGTSGPEGSGSETPVTSDTTLTYTLGTGSSTTVITTTIKHTSTATVYATKPAEVTGAAASSSEGLTTTIQGTSTSTKYVTVIPASSSAEVSGNSGAGGDSPASVTGAAASCAPVTVTETVALSTVTVTAIPTPAGEDVAAVTAGSGSGNADASSSVEEVTVSTATVVPVPVSTGAPYGNGTEHAATTKKPCSSVFPSGFIQKPKPTDSAPIAKYKA